MVGFVRQLSLAASLVLMLATSVSAAEADAAADTAAGWQLEDLYASNADWEKSFGQLKTATASLTGLRGTLGTAEGMFKTLDSISGIQREYSRLRTYAVLLSDADIRVAANKEREQKIQTLGTQIGENTAWLAPEMLAVGPVRARQFVAANPELKRRFGFFIDNTMRSKPHTLGTEAEGVLASVSTLLQQPDALHSVLADAELKFPEVTLASGEKVQLSSAAYTKYRQANNRDDRRKVFDAYWSSWKQYEGTFGSALTMQVMGDVFSAKTRHFASSLDSALFSDNMPSAVYRRLVAETNAALPTLYRYLKLRKRVLGITDELRYYDNYPSLFPLTTMPTYSVADSERITLAALQPLGEDYLDLLRKGFSGRWMNVFPSPGKASGAYMSGSAYDVHPYLLLNHNNDYYSLSTFAHEWGHAVHTLLTTRAQPYELANYSTFTAESASIGNEMLLIDYMKAQAKIRAEKLFFLGEAVESIRQIFFRQVMFAEFELALHEEVEQARPLSGARMTEMYCGLLRKYYGEAQGVMKIDPEYCVEWAFIPHFYYNFYLYQYATSMAGAASLTAAILRDGAPARERFLALLRAGGSDYPYELYKKTGIDMAQGTPYQALIARMNSLLDEIEKLEQEEKR